MFECSHRAYVSTVIGGARETRKVVSDGTHTMNGYNPPIWFPGARREERTQAKERITPFRERERLEPEISRRESPERIGMTRIIPNKSEVPDPPRRHTK